MENVVTHVKATYFDGSLKKAAEFFGVSSVAFRKWELEKEFPAKSGRMQQAHELTKLDYVVLAPSIFKLPALKNSNETI
ncbi:hypothetical protein [Photobacterium kishitanii]|uniref:hypothetical protein n=1 Tax=Photobacterium kishitanii TaxID=318456 RepID=UPI0004360430|nr:hypothetical protein [Photobacterium kishitanii]CEO39420.1 conserved hypothetical protein [Photobacterium kishitanii]